MEKSVLVPMANGSEELETVAIVDIVRRAGASVVLASVNELTVRGSKGVSFVADRLLSDCVHEVFDLIALPGGMPGAEALRDSSILIDLIRRQAREGRFYAAICASPAVVLYPLGLLEGKRFTCHPHFVFGIDGQLVDKPVVVDGNLITGRGAGRAIDFGLVLVEVLYGPEKAFEVSQGMAL